jgi:hypothetical protein
MKKYLLRQNVYSTSVRISNFKLGNDMCGTANKRVCAFFATEKKGMCWNRLNEASIRVKKEKRK